MLTRQNKLGSTAVYQVLLALMSTISIQNPNLSKILICISSVMTLLLSRSKDIETCYYFLYLELTSSNKDRSSKEVKRLQHMVKSAFKNGPSPLNPKQC